MYQPIYPKGITFPNDNFMFGEGENLLIITGWSPVKILAKKITKPYAAIGNLYSTSLGITSLIRNIYLNPQITEIELYSLTKSDINSGSCQCFMDFITNGVEWDKAVDKHKIISNYVGYIDKEIPLEYLNLFRESVNCYLYTK